VTVFEFIAAKRAEHPVKTLCRVLGVSRSGFHAWTKRAPSARAREDERLTERIGEIHALNRGVYGSPRIHAELVMADGERIARKRVERLMRQAGLSGLVRRKRGRTTIAVPGVRVCEDLVDRAFMAAAPDRLWVADITYLRTWEGWLYLVAVQDVYSRRIVGWAIADHMRTELVLDALAMALARRRPAPGLIWHSDQGSQFVSSRSASRPAPPASPNRWAAKAIAGTTPSPRASSPRSRRNSSTGAPGRRRPNCAASSLTTSRPSITASAATAGSDFSRPPATRRSQTITI
jgi:putative transposase